MSGGVGSQAARGGDAGRKRWPAGYGGLLTQTLLDVARKDPNRDNGELVDRLHAVNTRAIDLKEALLLLSRADQRTFAREYVDLSLLAEDATETLLPLAEEPGVTIETSGEMTPAVGSCALLLQMTTNLVHNAIVHNLPEQGTLWVTTDARPNSVELTVENTGEKLTPRLVSTLAEPFQRDTKRIRTDQAGVGLGLAIVKSIAQAHDGTLTLTPRTAGGLGVTVQLPAAPLDTGDDHQRSCRSGCEMIESGRASGLEPLRHLQELFLRSHRFTCSLPSRTNTRNPTGPSRWLGRPAGGA